ncbi:MAG: hypothetical protein ACK55I_40510, partial [bacterium]
MPKHAHPHDRTGRTVVVAPRSVHEVGGRISCFDHGVSPCRLLVSCPGTHGPARARDRAGQGSRP